MRQRLAAFVTVGALGFLLQIGTLAALTFMLRWPYGVATMVGVELAILHNFCWHERWTWGDRTRTRRGMLARLGKYHATTGLTSITGNLLLTTLWVEVFGISPVAANAAAVVTMSVANFLVADRWVFARRPALAVTVLMALPAAPAGAAELSAETLAAWNRYVDAAEASHHPTRPLTLAHAEPEGETIRVPGGTIHRWRGSVQLQGATVEQVVSSLMHPGTPPPQEDVIASRLLARDGDSLRVYLKLVRKAVVTVTYDTEHDVTFVRHGPGLATSRSVGSKIAESGGGDRGFLWRLNSYWRYVQVGNDVRVELESLSLSRGVPALLRPVASPIISRIARESMARTLWSLQRHFM